MMIVMMVMMNWCTVVVLLSVRQRLLRVVGKVRHVLLILIVRVVSPVSHRILVVTVQAPMVIRTVIEVFRIVVAVVMAIDVIFLALVVLLLLSARVVLMMRPLVSAHWVPSDRQFRQIVRYSRMVSCLVMASIRMMDCLMGRIHLHVVVRHGVRRHRVLWLLN